MNCKFFTIACALLSMSFCSWANENKTDSVGYQFTVTKELKTNPVKDQSRSGTCWSFSTLSFIEDDLLRQGKPAVDLSEMFIVRNDYIEKAIKYTMRRATAPAICLTKISSPFSALMTTVDLSLSVLDLGK